MADHCYARKLPILKKKKRCTSQPDQPHPTTSRERFPTLCSSHFSSERMPALDSSPSVPRSTSLSKIRAFRAAVPPHVSLNQGTSYHLTKAELIFEVHPTKGKGTDKRTQTSKLPPACGSRLTLTLFLAFQRFMYFKAQVGRQQCTTRGTVRSNQCQNLKGTVGKRKKKKSLTHRFNWETHVVAIEGLFCAGLLF